MKNKIRFLGYSRASYLIKKGAKTEKMTLGQTVRILDRYLEEHPEELHKSVAISFIYAIDEIVYK